MGKAMRIVTLALALSVAGVSGAAAQEEEEEYGGGGCVTSFLGCMERAAAISSFVYRTAAALDCELDLVECTRIKLIGG